MWDAKRLVGFTESADFLHFPPAQVVLRPDEQDPPDMDMYTSGAMKYPYAANAYLIFTTCFHHTPDTTDTQLATSRDGVNWFRPSREPFMPQGQPETLDSKQLYVSPSFVRTGDEISIYYSGYEYTHAQARPEVAVGQGTISRAVLRMDGYMSVDAGPRWGSFVTKPLTFAGRHLQLNVKAGPEGEVRVGLLDEVGKPIRDFSVGACDAFRGDSLASTITWHGTADLSGLAGKRVRMQVRMKDAKLYAFQFAD